MNTLSYIINTTDNSDYVFQAIIDSKITRLRIDVAALDVSRQQGGVCPILFCDCGYMGCTGYYANVEIIEDEIIWPHFYDRFYNPEKPDENKTDEAHFNWNTKNKSHDFTLKAPLKFNKSEYNALADKLIGELKNYPHQETNYTHSVKSYKEGNCFRA